ncbi:hypothetical protein [Moorena producens]|uniref:hypothetical protein n=1 Tax=Moorena producens TaxID=1155739 RepID=UPI003C73F6D2
MSITFTLSWITLLFIEASGNYAILWQFSMVLGSRELGVGCRVWVVGDKKAMQSATRGEFNYGSSAPRE